MLHVLSLWTVPPGCLLMVGPRTEFRSFDASQCNSVSFLFAFFKTVRGVHNPAAVGWKSGKYQDTCGYECNGLSHRVQISVQSATVAPNTKLTALQKNVR